MVNSGQGNSACVKRGSGCVKFESESGNLLATVNKQEGAPPPDGVHIIAGKDIAAIFFVCVCVYVWFIYYFFSMCLR